ncbi:PepSY domain-containing protein [Peribacillus huizhouensis]|uniref:Membrane protein YkoI n=1 Tax=Peribacillus huizhouensis TaxID=1501239 RepID=A0ABR6CVK0_9BACI|nr:PepSY domain-containing protein [Peribacillus huizhouensis]MBA9028989.1 putative membrane protein YkoI [Peribacillus huizhouensis]
MQFITKLITGAIIIGGIGASAYAMKSNKPTTIQTNETSPKSVISQKITEQKANQLALIETKGGIVTNTHLDEDNEVKKYEVIIVKQNKKFEIDIDALTGKVLEVDQNILGKSDLKIEVNELQNVSTNISLVDAKQIALNKVRGTITESELDYYNNRIVYKFEISTADHRETEVIIDANSGQVVKVEEYK